ncbi:hypothetical protein WA158_003279 [Blastocystis sp. Blastoise]
MSIEKETVELFSSKDLINDIYNIFDAYINDGIHSFEDALKSIFDQNEIEYTEDLQQGTNKINIFLKNVIEKNMDKLEIFANRNLFITVNPLPLKQSLPVSLLKEEYELDKQIKELKKSIYTLNNKKYELEIKQKRLQSSLMTIIKQFQLLSSQLSSEELLAQFTLLSHHIDMVLNGQELIYRLNQEINPSQKPLPLGDYENMEELHLLSKEIDKL